jgi:kinesin family protein 5
MVGKIAEITIKLERQEYEKSETQLTIESLTEQKEALQQEVEKLQAELAEVAAAHKKLSIGATKKEEARQSKMAALEESQKQFLHNTEKLRLAIESDVSRMDQMGSTLTHPSEPLASAAVTSATLSDADRKRMEDMEHQLAEMQNNNKQLMQENESMRARFHELGLPSPAHTDLTLGVKPIKAKDEDLVGDLGLADLDSSLRVDDLDLHPIDVEPKTSGSLAAELGGVSTSGSGGVESFEMEMLRTEMETYKRDAENMKRERDSLAARIESMQSKVSGLEEEKEAERATQNEDKRLKLEQELHELRQKTATKLAEFDTLKTSLLRDLQNRCEKVHSPTIFTSNSLIL